MERKYSHDLGQILDRGLVETARPRIPGDQVTAI
jgi:hypothetical protein